MQAAHSGNRETGAWEEKKRSNQVQGEEEEEGISLKVLLWNSNLPFHDMLFENTFCLFSERCRIHH